MAENSKIEWTDHTVNLWWGCAKVHTGCKNCYAEHLSDVRYKNNLWGEKSERKRIKSAFNDLTKYQKQAKKEGIKVKVFMGSMMDIFEDSKTLINPSKLPHTGTETGQLRGELFDRISNSEFDNLIFLLLTKRPENINYYIPFDWIANGAPENVWFGTSVSDQETANKYIPRLLKINGNKFLSIEPQTGKIDLHRIDADLGGDKAWCMINCLNGKQTDMGRPCVEVQKIDWIIQGGESGSKKRPFNIEWAESMRDQCEKYETPYFFKQIDKVHPIPEHLNIRQFPEF